MGWWEGIKSGAAAVGNFITGGGQERRRSERIVKNAKEDEFDAKCRLEEKRKSTNGALESLGELRRSAHEGAITDFVNLYETIAAITKQEFATPDQFVDHEIKSNITKMLPAPGYVKEMMLGGTMGALGGAAAAYGAYGLAGIVGTASTGTAISSLGGVAATNATLAWLGGGAAAAGGLGTIGGAAVLGGIALIPAAIVAMYFGQNAAKKQLNEALNYSDQVDVFVAQSNTFILQLDQIEQAAKLLHRAVLSMEAVVRMQNSKMRYAIQRTVEQARELQDCLYLEFVDARGQYRPESRSAYQAIINADPVPNTSSSEDDGAGHIRVSANHSPTLANIEA